MWKDWAWENLRNVHVVSYFVLNTSSLMQKSYKQEHCPPWGAVDGPYQQIQQGNEQQHASSLPVCAGYKQHENSYQQKHAQTILSQRRWREEKTSTCQTALGHNILGSMPSCVTGWKGPQWAYCFSLACSQKMASVFYKGEEFWWHKARLSWFCFVLFFYQGKLHSKREAEQGPCEQDVIHASRSASSLRKATRGQIWPTWQGLWLGSKSFRSQWKRWYTFWSGAWPM